MLISETFFTLQGEGTYVGVPSIFIRTSGCNLRCHFCFVQHTRINDGRVRPFTKIYQVRKGDIVNSADPESKFNKIIKVKVLETMQHEVNPEDLIYFSLKRKDFISTKDHPFVEFRTHELIKAGDLQVGMRLKPGPRSYGFPCNYKKIDVVQSLNKRRIGGLASHFKKDTITVYNFKTENGYYIANGFMVHNCDTPYTSWWNDGSKESLQDIVNNVNSLNKNGFTKHVVISGGEPLIQKKLPDLVKELQKNNYYVTIETNGTIFNPDVKADLFSISPKLKNSLPDKDKHPADYSWEAGRKIHIKNNTYDNLKRYVESKHNCQFKFVVYDENDLPEILEIINTYKIPREKVFLMPEGITKEVQQQRSEQIAHICKEYGFTYCPRVHINIWGPKRGV